MRPLFLLLALLPACASHSTMSRDLLQPNRTVASTPADFGLSAERVTITARDGTSIAAWWIADEKIADRTVVLFGPVGSNTGQMAPYYTFLRQNGCNVLTFDYRGCGESGGEPSLNQTMADCASVLAWVKQRCSIAGSRIVLHGVGIGATLAMRTAIDDDAVDGLVLDCAASPLQAWMHRNPDSAHFAAAGIAEMSGMPEELEPEVVAKELKIPALFITCAKVAEHELKPQLSAYIEYRGRKSLWVLPDTGNPPAVFLQHGNEYRETVAEFLRHAGDKQPALVAASAQPSSEAASANWYEVQLTGPGGNDGNQAVVISAVDAELNASTHRVWLQGASGSFRLRFGGAPAAIGAAVQPQAVAAADGTWTAPVDGDAAAGAFYLELQPALDELSKATVDLATARTLANTIEDGDKAGRISPALAAELCGAYYLIGRNLIVNGDALDKERGRRFLQRAVDAAPASPRTHFWPGTPASYGFRHANEVAEAKRILAASSAPQPR